MLTPDEFSFAYPYLANWLRALDALHNGMKAVTSLGIVALPWDPETRRAYVRLDYADGTNDLFLGFQHGTLNDVTTDEGRPFPVLYPAALLAGGGYAIWDMVRQRAILFRLDTPRNGPKRLILAAPGGIFPEYRTPRVAV